MNPFHRRFRDFETDELILDLCYDLKHRVVLTYIPKAGSSYHRKNGETVIWTSLSRTTRLRGKSTLKIILKNKLAYLISEDEADYEEILSDDLGSR